jgi:hypothetical protein
LNKEVVEREPEGVVLTRHWTCDGATEASANSSRVEGAYETGIQKVNLHLQIKASVVVHHDVECKRVKKSENMMEGM